MSIDTAFAGHSASDYLYRLGDIILNTDDSPTDPFVDIVDVTGLDSAPAREGSVDLGGMDGGYVNAEFESVRHITLEGVLYCNDLTRLETYLDDLKATFAVSSTSKPFFVQAPGVGPRVIFCKPLGVRYDVNTLRRTGQCKIMITLKAEDPSFYGAEESVFTGLGSGASAGRGYDKSYDYGYGGGDEAAGVLTANVGGNKPTGGQFVISGPIENPTILNEVTGQLMRFDITLQPGESLVIDLRYKTVRLNGETPRRNTLKGTNVWFLLAPGVNTFRFGGTQFVAGPPDALLQLFFRPAFR